MWKKQASLIGNMAPKLVPISDTEFIAVPYTHNQDDHTNNSIQRYNVTTNTWTDIMSYPSTLYTTCNSVTFNPGTEEIYLFGMEGVLTKIHIRTRKIKRIPTSESFGAFPMSIIIDGIYHVIGGTLNNKHCIWNESSQTFIPMHTFNAWTGCMFPGLVHVKHKNILLLFGGSVNMSTIGGIMQGQGGTKPQDSIWCYYITANKWELLDVELERATFAFGSVLAEDEQYIILLGGMFGDKISIFNTESFEFEDVDMNIEWPRKESTLCFATMCKEATYNEILILGYVKQLCHSNRVLPMDIIPLIQSWCNVDVIHMITFGESGSHWKIEADYICDTVAEIDEPLCS
eukprot:917081_1